MIDILVKLFVKDSDNIKKDIVRSSYGKLSSIIGIILNIILFVSKLLVGTFFGSVAITADAINNLSDAGSSIISLVSFKFSVAPADDEHPFGHARVEYIASMAVAIFIILLAIEIAQSAITAILNPVIIGWDWLMIAVLGFSILGKFWLYVFNKKIGNKIASTVLLAVASDSLSDILSTSAVLISAIISPFIGIATDGYIGAVVSILIFISGVKIILESMNKLLGDAPSAEIVDEIQSFIGRYDGVMGMHDLVVHSYGYGKLYASVHVEVDAKVDILKSHDIIDDIERDIQLEKQIHLVIHMDPIVTDDPTLDICRNAVLSAINRLDKVLSMHDFRMVRGDAHHKLIFDIVVPHKFRLSDKEIRHRLEQALSEQHPECYLIITFDHSYTRKL